MRPGISTAAIMLSLLVGGNSVWADKTDEAPTGLIWMDDYADAYQRAEQGQRMLLVYFHGERPNTYRDRFENESLRDARVMEKLRDYVLVKQPLDAKITVGGKETKLLDHAAFNELSHSEGLAVVDLVHKDKEHHGQVVSVIPFTPGRYYHFQSRHLAVLLDLPPGTLTQRSMIFAVRIHPEAPASTYGQPHDPLMHGARQHSSHQASIQSQGHHNWDSRFQHLTSALPGGLHAQEVVAESWPHQKLMDACVDCVHSWRQSPGHWGAVRRQQPLFGYDIRRGGNGIWYATGIFGNRH
ncbi:MAG: hypothetical protein JNM18_01460 [Planctomycetaceae bacterium]|nr:hypothetical protein [Planctomycetaceae bacterium]